MFELTGRCVIITGAAQGFGKEFARRLLQENCCVCISDIDIEIGNKTKSEFQKEFELTENELCFVKCNVAVEQDWIDLWDNAEKLLNGPIEVLINNAGVHPGVGFPLEFISLQTLDSTLEDLLLFNRNKLFWGEHKVITPKQQFLGIILCFFMYLKWLWPLHFFAKML